MGSSFSLTSVRTDEIINHGDILLQADGCGFNIAFYFEVFSQFDVNAYAFDRLAVELKGSKRAAKACAIRDAKKKAAIKLTGTRVPSYEIVNRRSERMKLALQSVMASCSTGLRRLGGRFPGCYDSRVNIQ